MNAYLTTAITIAAEAHDLQVDKAGVPYIYHPLRVMEASRRLGGEAACIAVLHDVLEDTEWTAERLHPHLSAEIVIGVVTLTRAKHESYDEYLARIRVGGTIRLIKLEDVRDNFQRLHDISDLAVRNRLLRKYEHAFQVLSA